MESFFSDDQYLIPAIEDDPLLREYTTNQTQPSVTAYSTHIRHLEAPSGDWSDEEDASAPEAPPKDLEAALHKIEVLEASLKKARQNFVDYREFVTKSLNVENVTEAAASTSTTDPVAPARDDDSHYFTVYGTNGT